MVFVRVNSRVNSVQFSQSSRWRYKLFVLVKDCGYGLGLALERMGKKDSGGGGKKDGGGKGGAKANGICYIFTRRESMGHKD